MQGSVTEIFRFVAPQLSGPLHRHILSFLSSGPPLGVAVV